MLYYGLILLAVNLLTFAVYGLDKRAAKRGTWRTPEKRMLLFGVLGGAAGGILGMLCFHHKTRKLYFWIVNLFGICVHTAILLWYFRLVLSG